jgi:hypothetical protein
MVNSACPAPITRAGISALPRNTLEFSPKPLPDSITFAPGSAWAGIILRIVTGTATGAGVGTGSFFTRFGRSAAGASHARQRQNTNINIRKNGNCIA